MSRGWCNYSIRRCDYIMKPVTRIKFAFHIPVPGGSGPASATAATMAASGTTAMTRLRVDGVEMLWVAAAAAALARSASMMCEPPTRCRASLETPPVPLDSDPGAGQCACRP
jgi:hypothetical protein